MEERCVIEHNADGLPIFSMLDLENDGSGTERRVLEVYLEYVWAVGQG